MPREIKETSVPPTRIEYLAGGFSRHLAGRISRRSFMGSVGRGAIAATMGTLATPFLIRPALAHTNSCQSFCSASCRALTGSNSCPSGSCNCGCWCIRVSSSTCSSTYREWCDCCGGCGDSDRGCINGTDNLTHPTCLLHKEWPEGCSDTHIKCRFHRCVSQSSCERVNTECDQST